MEQDDQRDGDGTNSVESWQSHSVDSGGAILIAWMAYLVDAERVVN